MTTSLVAHFCIFDHESYALFCEEIIMHSFKVFVYTKHSVLLKSLLEENSLVDVSSR